MYVEILYIIIFNLKHNGSICPSQWLFSRRRRQAPMMGSLTSSPSAVWIARVSRGSSTLSVPFLVGWSNPDDCQDYQVIICNQ